MATLDIIYRDECEKNNFSLTPRIKKGKRKGKDQKPGMPLSKLEKPLWCPKDRSGAFVGVTEKHILSMSAEMAYGKQSPSVEWEGETWKLLRGIIM